MAILLYYEIKSIYKVYVKMFISQLPKFYILYPDLTMGEQLVKF